MLLKHYLDQDVSKTRTNETMMHGVWYGVVWCSSGGRSEAQGAQRLVTTATAAGSGRRRLPRHVAR